MGRFIRLALDALQYCAEELDNMLSPAKSAAHAAATTTDKRV
jgi:hypothetical protein